MPVFAPQLSTDAAAVLMSLRSISTETCRAPAVTGGRVGSGTTKWCHYNTAAQAASGVQTAYHALPGLLLGREIQRLRPLVAAAERAVTQDFVTYRAELMGIAPASVEAALAAVLTVTGVLLGAERIHASLTPERSLHVRAVLPEGVGTVRVSVLLYAGVQPHVRTGVADVDDNTLVSVFSPAGELRPDLGADAPLATALETTIGQLFPLVRRQREQALGLR